MLRMPCEHPTGPIGGHMLSVPEHMFDLQANTLRRRQRYSPRIPYPAHLEAGHRGGDQLAMSTLREGGATSGPCQRRSRAELGLPQLLRSLGEVAPSAVADAYEVGLGPVRCGPEL